MTGVEPNEQFQRPTLGVVFAHVAHLRPFIHPETKHQALYSHFLGCGSRSVLWGGYLGISRRCQNVCARAENTEVSKISSCRRWAMQNGIRGQRAGAAHVHVCFGAL